MSARSCPACGRELPEATLRALEQGTACPHCATRLKRTPRRARPALPTANDQAAFQVSLTPAVIAQPGDEDSFGWFQNKASPGAAAPATVTAAPAPARSLFESPAGGAPGPTPPVSRSATGPARAAPAAVPAARVPVVMNVAPAASTEVEKPVSPPVAKPAAEPPRTALAMTAVVPSAGSTLALAAPATGLSRNSRRNVALAAGTATLTLALAILFVHRASADRAAPVAVRETSRPSRAIQPLPSAGESAPARPAEAEPSAGEASADLAGTTTHAPHAKRGTTHRATAHQRRTAKHGKRARHERRNARATEVASRATPPPADEGEARASYQRGNALLFAGDAAGAVAAYRRAVALAPADPIGYRGLGLAYEQQGGTGPAIRALRKYLKLAPGAADREIISRRIARLGHAGSHR